MLRLAGQTAGPNGLKFFVNIHGWPGDEGCFKLKKFDFFQIFLSTGNAVPLQLVFHEKGLKTNV